MNWKVHSLIIVMGDPKAQPRPRAFAMNGKARVYDSATAEGWKGLIAEAARKYLPKEPIEGPVSVYCRFLFKRPQRLMRKKDPIERIPHTAKPDRDNLDKAVLDTLTQIGFWRDDSQVCAGKVEKFYCRKDGSPGAEILILTPDTNHKEKE